MFVYRLCIILPSHKSIQNFRMDDVDVLILYTYTDIYISHSFSTTWVWILAWADLKEVSSLTLLHYVLRSLGPFSLPCAQKRPQPINRHHHGTPIAHRLKYCASNFQLWVRIQLIIIFREISLAYVSQMWPVGILIMTNQPFPLLFNKYLITEWYTLTCNSWVQKIDK